MLVNGRRFNQHYHGFDTMFGRGTMSYLSLRGTSSFLRGRSLGKTYHDVFDAALKKTLSCPYIPMKYMYSVPQHLWRRLRLKAPRRTEA